MELVIIVDSESDVPLIEETVRVDPIIVWKYPVVVESVGTWIDDRTVKDEVTCASCVVRKLDWIDEPVNVEITNDVPVMDDIISVDPDNV